MSNSPAELKTVNRIQFGVINPEELKAQSVVEVKHPGTYEKGIPLVDGLLDQRMGVTDRGLQCLTCKMDEENCPGHFGHVTLSVPVVHIGFADIVLQILRCVCFHCGRLLLSSDGAKKDVYSRIIQIQHPQSRLQAFVRESSGIKTCVGGNITGEFRQQQLQLSGITPSVSSAGGCGGTQPSYRRIGYKISRLFDKDKNKSKKKSSTDQGDSLTAMNSGADDVIEQSQLSGAEILNILSKISDHDILALGFNPQYAHPKWLITTVLPVTPPAVRPSVTFNGADRSADDITVALAAIIKINNSIIKSKLENATEATIQNDTERLTLACAQLVNNEITNCKQMTSKSGKILKTLRQRLVGKGGRIRANLMGKRVNFCARTVITGDPNLGIDFVGVPRWIARTLTYPEVVTSYNIDKLQLLVRNGPETYPGAQRIIKPDGSIIHLKYMLKENSIILQPGYIVERHVIDNDFILFNRQPSLHKMSLMGHKAKVMPYSSFRLNLTCTSPYNADFDGDEMNLHVAQSPLLRAEIAEIMLSPRQIVSPQASKPIMGIVQDSLLGVSKFTRRDTFCDRNLTNNLLMCVDTWNGVIPHPAILKPAPLWTGKQIFSLIIPKGINLIRGSKHRPKADKDNNMSFSDASVLISNGELLSGIVDANTVGKTEAGIIHIVWLERGWDDTRQFITSCQKLVNNWLVTAGFSVGIYDLMASKQTLDRVKKIVDKSHVDVQAFIDQARSGKMQRKPGHSIISTFEANVNETLNKAVTSSGQAVQEDLARDNSINAMVYAGSKGSHLNISQIVACVGQQNVSGKRIPFTYRRRSLPHFLKEDVGLASRGFVSSSYIKGLTPTEFYFHAMGGREGLVDTAVKTAETGYIQRRLVKSMESIKVHYDATVRNSLGDILQFVYGEDGMDGCFIEKLTMDHLTLDNNSLKAGYFFDLEQPELLDLLVIDDVKQDVLADPDAMTTLSKEYHQVLEDRNNLRASPAVIKLGENSVRLPCNLPRIILSAQQKFDIKLEGGRKDHAGVIRLDLGKKSDLSPVYIVHQVESLLKRLIVIPGNSNLSREAQSNATQLFSMYIRQILASKRILGEFHLNKASFDYVIGEVESRFKQALVHPGEMVGAIAAQSIGEPATQMTLNTFHLAGYSAKNVTSGVPRLVEIINVARNVKMKGMTVELRDKKKAQDDKQTTQILNRLEFSRVCDIASCVEIYHDPVPTECVVESDRGLVEGYLAFPDDDFNAEHYQQASPWLLRIVLNRPVAIAKDLLPAFVAKKVNQHFAQISGGEQQKVKVKCIASETLGDELVLHIRTSSLGDINEEGEDINLAQIYTIKDIVLDRIKLCGITNITKIFLKSEPVKHYDEITGKLVSIPEDQPGGKYWMLETEGTNLPEVIVHEEVDHRTCYSNFCPDMLPVCGIEATRASILKEIRSVIEADGSYISYRHVAMLVDVMTFKGTIMSITRHGFNRLHTGPLMRCSFEESVEILMDAAAFSENDPLEGISEKVMMGQLANIGTGCFDVVLDVDKLSRIDTTALSLSSAVSGGGHHAMNANALGDGMSDLKANDAGASFDPSMWDDIGSGRTSNQYANHFSPTSSAYISPQSGAYLTSASYSPTSTIYAAQSQSYSPTSHSYSPTSTSISPISHSYSPTSGSYSPTSANYSPTSANYSPTSANYSPTSANYSPTSANYSPTSANYSPTSANYSPTSANYSPTSPAHASPASGVYGSPTSPAYNTSPTSGAYSPQSGAYSPQSGAYSPQSGAYEP